LNSGRSSKRSHLRSSLDSDLIGVQGEFYGMQPNGTANLELLNRFFAKYPEYAERTFLSVKVRILTCEQ
jgi:hypothetical protein